MLYYWLTCPNPGGGLILLLLLLRILVYDGVVEAVRLSAVARGEPIIALFFIFGTTFFAEADFLLGEKLDDFVFS